MNSTTTKDLTQGNIYHQLVTLSVPLIIGNILQQFYNTIDAFVVGRYAGAEEFAAIGVAGTVMNLFLFLIVGCCTGLSVLFARYYGTGDVPTLRRQHFTALLFGLLFSLLLCGIGLLGMRGLLTLIQTPDAILPYACQYLFWIFLSLPAAFLYNMYAAALRASGDTVAALVILTAAVVSNLLLDLLLVADLHLGIKGAALATALTQLFSALLCICYLLCRHREFLFYRKDCRLDATMLSSTLQCSLATAIHQGSLYIGKMLVQGTVNTGGLESILAYTAATRIEGFANSFGDSCSAATSVIVSQSYGAGKKQRVQEAFHSSIRLTALLGLLSAVILFLSAPLTIRLMLGSSDGSEFSYAVTYLKVVACFYLFCFTGGSFTGLFNGIGKVHLTLAGSTLQITMWVILSWLLFSGMGLSAVAMATGIGWILCNAFWGIYYRISKSHANP